MCVIECVLFILSNSSKNLQFQSQRERLKNVKNVKISKFVHREIFESEREMHRRFHPNVFCSHLICDLLSVSKGY